MSIEFALEKYPLEGVLKDGTAYSVRPLLKRDAARVFRFFTDVPEPERLFYKRRVTNRLAINQWCRNLCPEEEVTLLMLAGEKVIGLATLEQPQGGWKRHIGSVTMLTHPKYRGRGVVRILVDELTVLARHLGLKRLEAELNGERTVALKSLEQLGFRKLLRLPDYLQDMQCRAHDYLLLGMDLITDEEYASAG